MIVQDFNYMTNIEDKRGDKLFILDMASRKFIHFMDSNGLLDMRFVESRFTWCCCLNYRGLQLFA